MDTVPLTGSERPAVPLAQVLGPADPAERLEVSVIVRRRDNEGLRRRVAKLAAGDRSDGILTRQQFAIQHGADPNDFGALRAFALAHALVVVQESAPRRTMVLSGTVAQFDAAFGLQLQRWSHDAGTYRGHTGAIALPAELDGIIEAVLGLDNRPQAKPHFRIRRATGHVRSIAKTAPPVSYTPVEVASLYEFPAGNGAGQCVALIELGGGYRPTDLATYFKGLGLSAPELTAYSVDHGQNAPTGDPNGPDGEVMLDIEVVGAIAPKARIVAYFAPNTDAGFLDAVTTAIHDSVHNPSVISISWGSAESAWTAQAMTSMDEAFQAAASLGVTVCVASGDSGSGDGVSVGGDHVDFPASSPHALACGGTSLRTNQTAILSEVVWNDGASGGASGGGMSSFFVAPAWQSGDSAKHRDGDVVPLTQRGVPDVAGNADPETGYNVRIDGSDTVIGGTSAVAPLWAALIARINQARTGGAVGFLNPQLYQSASALRDITEGNNGDFEATPGWDACTGLGSPIGALLAPKL
jgi:kumamolisin